MQVYLETLARLSLGVSLGAISQQLVDTWELSPSPSDNGVEDIVFFAKILPEPGAQSHYCLVILFQYRHFNLFVTRPSASCFQALCKWQRRRYVFVLLRAVRKASLSTRRGRAGRRKIIVLQPWKYDFTHNPKTLNITLSASSYFLCKTSGHKSLHDVDNWNTTPGRHTALLKK